MKLIRKSLEKDSSGDITLLPEDAEDLWAVYNLIQRGDEIAAKSIRRVTVGSAGKDSVRKLLKLRIKIDKIEFDAASSDLRIGGPVVLDTEDVSAGTFHTFTLELNRNFTLFKTEWDLIALEIVEKACDPENKAEVGAIVMHEGLAHICLLTENMTIVRARVEQSLPRKKRGDNSGFEKSLRKFYATVYSTMLRNINIEKLKALLIASPGFTARAFFDYMMQQAVIDNDKIIVKSKDKMLVTHSSSGHVHALEEILKNPDVQKQLADTKYGHETIVLDKFFKTLNDEDMRAWYGPKHVEVAVDRGAVSTLLLSDSLFRSNDILTRKKYIAMVETVRDSGGEALIFSSMHESGEQLESVTGIACILSYPLPELEDIEDEEEESD